MGVSSQCCMAATTRFRPARLIKLLARKTCHIANWQQVLASFVKSGRSVRNKRLALVLCLSLAICLSLTSYGWRTARLGERKDSYGVLDDAVKPFLVARMYHTGAGVNEWVPRIDPAYLQYGLKPRRRKSRHRLPPTWLQTMFLRKLLTAQRIKIHLNILLIRIRLTVLRVRVRLTVLCIRSLLAVWRIMVFLTVLCVRAHRQATRVYRVLHQCLQSVIQVVLVLTLAGYAASVIGMLLLRCGDVERSPGPVGQLGPNDLVTVLTELHEDSDQWYNLGLALNLTPGALDAIKGQYKDPKECLRDAVKAWLNMSPDPSWKAIVHALRSTIVGRDSSARRLEQEYCMQQQSEPPADLEAEVKSKTRGSGDGEGKTGDVAQLKGEESASQSDESSLRRGDCVIQEKDETSQTHIRELTQQLQDNETVLAAFQQKHVQQEIEIEQLHTTISAKHTEHNPPELQLLPFSAFRAAPGTDHTPQPEGRRRRQDPLGGGSTPSSTTPHRTGDLSWYDIPVLPWLSVVLSMISCRVEWWASGEFGGQILILILALYHTHIGGHKWRVRGLIVLLLVKAALLIGYLKYEQWIIAELIEMTEKTFLMFPMVIFYHNLTGGYRWSAWGLMLWLLWLVLVLIGDHILPRWIYDRIVIAPTKILFQILFLITLFLISKHLLTHNHEYTRDHAAVRPLRSPAASIH